MWSQRFTYTFIHEHGFLSYGMTKGEYFASQALVGLTKRAPEDIYAVSQILAEGAFRYADKMHDAMCCRTSNYRWTLEPAFPSNRFDGTWSTFDFPGLTAGDWVAAKLLTALTRPLLSLDGSYFVKPYIQRALEYTDALLQLLSDPPSRTAYPYKKEKSLTFRDRIETRTLCEVISYLPEPLKTDDITDVIRSARALDENRPDMFRGGTIGAWFVERMSPWLIYGIEPHTTVQHVYRFASQLAEILGLNLADSALPVIRYKRQDGGRQPISISRGLTIRAWITGKILGNLVCRMSTRFPWDDVVDRALDCADSLLSEYSEQGFDVDPGEPAYPLQIAQCRGEACTYEHANGLDVTLWLAGQILGSLARQDIPDISRAVKYSVYQSHVLFLESGKRNREAVTRFDPRFKTN